MPQSVFESLPGLATLTPVASPPQVSQNVVTEANANDGTIMADGNRQQPNKGAVLITAATTVQFKNNAGLHTITVNGQKQGADINAGDTRTITFSTPGEFKITCDYHAAMLATIFVQ